MVEKSLIEKGIKRLVSPPIADVETCKTYRPGAVCALGVVAEKHGLEVRPLFLSNVVPDWLVSGYRDKATDPAVKHSPHGWGDAFDVRVGGVLKQIEFIKIAIQDTQLFNRGGIYVGRNTCHIDQRNEEWMRKFGGTKLWVWYKGAYTGFSSFNEAVRYALKKSTPEG